jgi:hypothetical protein|tara:strand:+ start:1077 stop:1328 length:252 start_codon:yes stop_codon:yes gene_type:complete
MDEIVVALLPAIEEQLASPETAYVKEAFDRLTFNSEIDDEEARHMIAFCLADEVETMKNEDRQFNADRYQMLLNLLPALPEGR